MTIMTNIWVAIQKYCLKIIYHHRIQVSIIESPDIELLCYIKDIDLCIYWSLITMRKKSTSEIIKLSLNFEIVRTRLPSNQVVNSELLLSWLGKTAKSLFIYFFLLLLRWYTGIITWLVTEIVMSCHVTMKVTVTWCDKGITWWTWGLWETRCIATIVIVYIV